MWRGSGILVAVLCAAACTGGCATTPARAPAGRFVTTALAPPDSLVRGAVAALFDLKTGAFTETMTARLGRNSVFRTVDGTYDLVASRAELTTRYAASTPDAAEAVLAAPPGSLHPAALDQRAIRDQQSLYLSTPSWPGSRAGRWLRYSGRWLTGLGRRWNDTLGPPWDSDVDLNDPSPTALFGLPQKATDTVRFLPTTAQRLDRIEVTVPALEALPVIGASALVRPPGTGPGEAALDGEELPVELDLDPAGTLRRIHFDATHLVQQALGEDPRLIRGLGGPGAQFSYDLVLRRLGEPVQVSDPAPGVQDDGGRWFGDLAVGSCLAGDAVLPAQVLLTPAACTAPHRYEVYARAGLGAEADQFPGQVAAERLAWQRCGDAFRSFVGSRASASALHYWTAPPAEGAWLLGVRDAPCVLDAGGPVTGTLRGSGR